MFGRQQRGLKGCAVAMGLAVLAPAALFGGLPAVAQDKGEIAVMLPAAGDPYFKLKSFGYVDEGEKLGYEVTIYDAGGYGNLSRQVSQIEDVIQRGVDAIVLVPASSDGTVPVVEKAVDNGIPVINDGIATNTPKVTGFVGEDSYVMGEMLGVYIAEALGGKGNITMLSGPAGLDLTNYRVSGFKDYIALFPELQVVAEKFTSTSSAETMNVMQDFLQAHPETNAVYTFNGPIAIGAVQALRAAGRQPGDVVVTTMDLEVETERLMRDGWIQMTVVSQPVNMARLAVRRAVEAAQGEDIPDVTLTQESVITKDTLDAVDLSGQEVPDDWGK